MAIVAGYYCLNERKIVLIRVDMFQHPHYLHLKSCFVCRECGGMVFLVEGVKKDAV